MSIQRKKRGTAWSRWPQWRVVEAKLNFPRLTHVHIESPTNFHITAQAWCEVLGVTKNQHIAHKIQPRKSGILQQEFVAKVRADMVVADFPASCASAEGDR